MNGSDLKSLRTAKGLSQQALADATNIPKGTIGRIEASGEEIKKVDVLNALKSYFKFETKPNSNPRLEAKPISLFPSEHDINPENPDSKYLYAPDGSIGMKVSVVPHKAQAGYRLGFADPEFYEDFDYVIIPVDQHHKSDYLGFEVVGESMVCLSSMEMAKRSIFPGRIAIGRFLSRHQWGYKLHTHNYSYWIIVHKTEGILIKEIANHDIEKGIITIHSLNPEYEDEELHMDDIEQIFSVVQIVEKTR